MAHWCLMDLLSSFVKVVLSPNNNVKKMKKHYYFLTIVRAPPLASNLVEMMRPHTLVNLEI